MEIIKINEYSSVETAVKNNEPLMAAIAFDGSVAYVCHLDDGVEHHILLMKAGYKGTEIDQFFRIVFDKEGADWTFVCPPDSTISEFLSEFGYLCDIQIPKRYKRHLDAMLDEG